jgi:hypothetical protein
MSNTYSTSAGEPLTSGNPARGPDGQREIGEPEALRYRAEYGVGGVETINRANE